jgi:TolB-like protein
VVSAQANKLRRALERYYFVAGQNDSIRIDIPKGAYVPTFHQQGDMEPDKSIQTNRAAESRSDGSWPTLLVRPFQNIADDPDLNYMDIGLATELATEITRDQDVRVLLFSPDGEARRVSDTGARFVVDGSIQKDASGIRITVQLIDLSNNLQIWSDALYSEFEVTQIIQFQERVAGIIAAKIAGEYGIIARAISIESVNKPPSELKTYETILRFYEYDQTPTPENAVRTMEALEQATTIDPNCGLVWSMLARLYAVIYSLDYPGVENPLEKAIEYAEKGANLNPINQRTIGILAYVRFLNNELFLALKEVHRALELNPNSLFILDGLAYVMILSGERERGKALAKKAIVLNPFYRPVVHYALWVDYLRQEKYDRTYYETMSLKRPSIFWYPLAKAATLGLLGRYEEGESFVEKLLELKPDFPKKGRVLIERYIKFEEIVDRVVEGLGKVGLKID